MKFKEKLKKKESLLKYSFIHSVLPKEFFDSLANIFYKAVYKAFNDEVSDNEN